MLNTERDKMEVEVAVETIVKFNSNLLHNTLFIV